MVKNKQENRERRHPSFWLRKGRKKETAGKRQKVTEVGVTVNKSIEVKGKPLVAVEIGGSNTTSVNVVNGEKKNSNDTSLSASFFWVVLLK